MLHFFQRTPNARSLLGNHERQHLGWFRRVITPALSQRITRLQLGEERYPAEKPVIVGDQDYPGTGAPVIFRDRIFGIDTGRYRGGALTGLLLPEFHLISVPARADHWSALKAAYASQFKVATWSARPGLAAEGAAGADVEWALCRLFDYIVSEHGRVLSELRNEAEWDSFTEREQAKRYWVQLRTRTPLT